MDAFSYYFSHPLGGDPEPSIDPNNPPTTPVKLRLKSVWKEIAEHAREVHADDLVLWAYARSLGVVFFVSEILAAWKYSNKPPFVGNLVDALKREIPLLEKAIEGAPRGTLRRMAKGAETQHKTACGETERTAIDISVRVGRRFLRAVEPHVVQSGSTDTGIAVGHLDNGILSVAACGNESSKLDDSEVGRLISMLKSEFDVYVEEVKPSAATICETYEQPKKNDIENGKSHSPKPAVNDDRPEFLVGDVSLCLDTSLETINKYATEASVETARRGGKDHRWSLNEIARIAEVIANSSAHKTIRQKCANWVADTSQIRSEIRT